MGIGPIVSFPTATHSTLGSGKWQAGATFVMFIAKSSIFQAGSLITWQISFAGDDDRKQAHSAAFQPFFFWQLGKGLYLRSAPIWFWNIQSGEYHIPFSIGIGKVVKVGRTIFNIFIEPQYSFMHKGTQPQFQVFTGINLQFMKKKK